MIKQYYAYLFPELFPQVSSEPEEPVAESEIDPELDYFDPTDEDLPEDQEELDVIPNLESLDETEDTVEETAPTESEEPDLN